MRSALFVFLGLASCLPKTFTYAEGGGGSGGGQGGGAVCGNGVVEAGEACDSGAASDDYEDETLAPDAPPAACSTTCRNMVSWSWRDPTGTEDSAAFGIAPIPGGYLVGGHRGTGLVPLDLVTVHYGGQRLLVSLSLAGSTETVFDPPVDPGANNAILGLVPNADGTVIALESEHVAGDHLYTYLSRWNGGTRLSVSPPLSSAQGAFAQLTAADGAGTVRGIGRQIDGNVHVVSVSATDESKDEIVFPGVDDGGSGAIASRPEGNIVVWDYQGAVLGPDAIPLSTFVVNAEITAGCARPDGTAVFAGWVWADEQYDTYVMILSGSGNLLSEATYAAPSGGWDGANALACAADGSFVVAGQETIDPVELDNLSYTQAVLRRFRADGTLAWTRRHKSPVVNGDGSVSQTFATSVAIEPDGSVLVAGQEMINVQHAVAWARRYAP